MTRTLAGGLAASMFFAIGVVAAPARLPYAAVHDPQFTPASEAAFLHDEDRVIGVIVGKTAKAYPAAILSQHGLVEDRSPNGPIAVTW